MDSEANGMAANAGDAPSRQNLGTSQDERQTTSEQFGTFGRRAQNPLAPAGAMPPYTPLFARTPAAHPRKSAQNESRPEQGAAPHSASTQARHISWLHGDHANFGPTTQSEQPRFGINTRAAFDRLDSVSGEDHAAQKALLDTTMQELEHFKNMAARGEYESGKSADDSTRLPHRDSASSSSSNDDRAPRSSAMPFSAGMSPASSQERQNPEQEKPKAFDFSDAILSTELAQAKKAVVDMHKVNTQKPGTFAQETQLYIASRLDLAAKAKTSEHEQQVKFDKVAAASKISISEQLDAQQLELTQMLSVLTAAHDEMTHHVGDVGWGQQASLSKAIVDEALRKEWGKHEYKPVEPTPRGGQYGDSLNQLLANINTVLPSKKAKATRGDKTTEEPTAEIKLNAVIRSLEMLPGIFDDAVRRGVELANEHSSNAIASHGKHTGETLNKIIKQVLTTVQQQDLMSEQQGHDQIAKYLKPVYDALSSILPKACDSNHLLHETACIASEFDQFKENKAPELIAMICDGAHVKHSARLNDCLTKIVNVMQGTAMGKNSVAIRELKAHVDGSALHTALVAEQATRHVEEQAREAFDQQGAALHQALMRIDALERRFNLNSASSAGLHTSSSYDPTRDTFDCKPFYLDLSSNEAEIYRALLGSDLQLGRGGDFCRVIRRKFGLKHELIARMLSAKGDDILTEIQDEGQSSAGRQLKAADRWICRAANASLKQSSPRVQRINALVDHPPIHRAGDSRGARIKYLAEMSSTSGVALVMLIELQDVAIVSEQVQLIEDIYKSSQYFTNSDSPDTIVLQAANCIVDWTKSAAGKALSGNLSAQYRAIIDKIPTSQLSQAQIIDYNDFKKSIRNGEMSGSPAYACMADFTEALSHAFGVTTQQSTRIGNVFAASSDQAMQTFELEDEDEREREAYEACVLQICDMMMEAAETEEYAYVLEAAAAPGDGKICWFCGLKAGDDGMHPIGKCDSTCKECRLDCCQGARKDKRVACDLRDRRIPPSKSNPLSGMDYRWHQQHKRAMTYAKKHGLPTPPPPPAVRDKANRFSSRSAMPPRGQNGRGRSDARSGGRGYGRQANEAFSSFGRHH